MRIPRTFSLGAISGLIPGGGYLQCLTWEGELRSKCLLMCAGVGGAVGGVGVPSDEMGESSWLAHLISFKKMKFKPTLNVY